MIIMVIIMEGKETKKDGGNLVLIIIIAILFVVTAFCAYKLGSAGRSVVDDANLQKGGNTSVPTEVEGKTDVEGRQAERLEKKESKNAEL